MARVGLIGLMFALLVGLFQMSNHMFAMPSIRMDGMTVEHINMTGEDEPAENSTMPCCNELAQFAMDCSYMVPQYANVDLIRGNKQIEYLAAKDQLIFIESVAPPPKV